MVVNVKNNLLLVPLVMFLLLVPSSYGGFSIKISESDINNICSKSAKPSFCVMFFKSYPEAKALNLPGVAGFVINCASRDAYDISKQFKSLVTSATDPHSKEIYNECSQLYEGAVDDFYSALKALVAKDNNTLNIKVSAAMTNGETCKDDVSSVKSTPELLKKMSYMEKLSDIVLVISKILPKQNIINDIV